MIHSKTALVRNAVTVSLALAVLTACQGTGSPTGPSASSPVSPASPAARHTPSRPPATAEVIDLREANVLKVQYELVDQKTYRFDVTLVHDDDGEAPSFADRWVVEDQDGNRLGERMLLHAHGSQPFTRSATIEIPPDVKVVIVRGHDQLHGFGGQAIVLDLGTGEARFVQDAHEP